MAAAFRLRHDEEYLSVNWVEYLGAPDLPAAVERIREVFRRKDYALRTMGASRCCRSVPPRLLSAKASAIPFASTTCPSKTISPMPVSSGTLRMT